MACHFNVKSLINYLMFGLCQFIVTIALTSYGVQRKGSLQTPALEGRDLSLP